MKKFVSITVLILYFRNGLAQDKANSRIERFFIKSESLAQKHADSAIAYARKIINFAIRTKKTFWLGKAYFLQRLIEDYQGKYKETIRWYNKAETVFNRKKQFGESARIENNIGIVYYLQGQLNQTIEHLLKAIELAQKSRTIILLSSPDLNGLNFRSTELSIPKPKIIIRIW